MSKAVQCQSWVILFTLATCVNFLAGCRSLHFNEPSASPVNNEAKNWVHARKIEERKDIFSGIAAAGKPGDFLLINERAKFVIAGIKNRKTGVDSAGSLIDAATINGEDVFGSLAVALCEEGEVEYKSIKITNEGEEGEATIVVTGECKSKENFELKTYYRLKADSQVVHIETEIKNRGPRTEIILSDQADFGYAEPYMPGYEKNSGKDAVPFPAGAASNVCYAVLSGSFETFHFDHSAFRINYGKIILDENERYVLKRRFAVSSDGLMSLRALHYEIEKKGTGAVTGLMADELDVPLSNVRVKIYELMNGEKHFYGDLYSDMKGEFYCRIEPGKYLLSAEKAGYRAFESGEFIIREDQEVICDFYLERAGVEILWGPFLQNIDRNSVWVSWKTDMPTVGRIKYRQKAEEKGWFIREDPAYRETHHVILQDLKPGFYYEYMLEAKDRFSDEFINSRKYVFKTEPALDFPFRFVVYADTAYNPELHGRLAEKLAALEPAFVLFNGCFIPDGRHLQKWDEWFLQAQHLASRAPFFTVLGSCENDTKFYYRNFQLPAGGGEENRQWYSFEYSAAHMTVLDSNSFFDSDQEDELAIQTEWLERDLKSSFLKPWRVVIFHHPLFDDKFYDAPTVDRFTELWEVIFIENDVQLVIASHPQKNRRIEKNGIVYQAVRFGSANDRGMEEKEAGEDLIESVQRDNPHYLIIDLSKESLKSYTYGMNAGIEETKSRRGREIRPSNIFTLTHDHKEKQKGDASAD